MKRFTRKPGVCCVCGEPMDETPGSYEAEVGAHLCCGLETYRDSVQQAFVLLIASVALSTLAVVGLFLLR